MQPNTCQLIHVLPASARRCFNRKEAASYVGVSPTSFDKLVFAGAMPQPNQLLGRKVWDIRALDRVLDALAGIEPLKSTNADNDRDSLDSELTAFQAKHGYA